MMRRTVLRSISVIVIFAMMFTFTNITITGRYVYAEETQYVSVTVNFTNSLGNGICDGQVSYSDGTWKVAGTTNAIGGLNILVPSSKIV